MILKDPAGEPLFLEGRLEGVSVPDLIHAICLPGRTGLLTLTQGPIAKKVYVHRGQLIFATSNLTEERLGETLLRSGVIGYRQLDEAVRKLGGGKRLGTILVELGYLDPPNLVRGLLHQVKEIILGLFPWSSGSYRFVEGALPTEELITLNIATPKLICDGIRRITSWPRIVRAVGSSRASYRLTRDGRLLAAELDLSEAERAILAVLEEPASVGRICHSVFLSNFDVYQHLWAFRILGIIRPVEPDPDRLEPGVHPGEVQGTVAETSVMELLLKLARAEETGVLHLTNGDEEKTVHLKEGVVSFATSNRSDESLTTFLLRRGVIALRDKEEIERRRLTNKRVGTILRDMGILSHDELVRFVREQLAEIVLGAMPWEAGDWRFLPGELPTLEAITLDRPVGELILQGIRGVRDWDRVRTGCGELDCRLGPAPWIQEALAGIEMSPDEKAILALVEEPRTVSEICGATDVPDFRTAQILWALRMVGAIEVAPLQEKVEAAPQRLEDAAFGAVAAAPSEGSTESTPEMPESISIPIAVIDDRSGSAGHIALAGEDRSGSAGDIALAGEDRSGSAGHIALAGADEPQTLPLSVPSEASLATAAAEAPASESAPAPSEAASIGAEAKIEETAAASPSTAPPTALSSSQVEEGSPPGLTGAAALRDDEPGSSGSFGAPGAAAEPTTTRETDRSTKAGIDGDGATAPPRSIPVWDVPEATLPGDSPRAASTDSPEAEAQQPESARPASPAGSAQEPAGQGASVGSSAETPALAIDSKGAEIGDAAKSREETPSPAAASSSGEPSIPSTHETAPVPVAETPASAAQKSGGRPAAAMGRGSRPEPRPGRTGAKDARPGAAARGRKSQETPADQPAPRTGPGAAPLTPLEAVGTGVLEEIGRFNRRHREVYGVFKAAVGAGARNLIATCAKKVGDSTVVFAGLAMDDTGAFPAEGLFERVGQLPPADIRKRLEALIAAETDFARQLLDGPTVDRLNRRLDSVAAEPTVSAS